MELSFENWFKILCTIGGAFFAYHRYIIGKIDDKVSRKECQTQNQHFMQLRAESNKTLFNKIEELREDIRDLKTHFMK